MRISIEIVSHELIGFESGFDAKISKGQEVLVKDPGVESRFSPLPPLHHFMGKKNILTSVSVWYGVWSALIFRLYSSVRGYKEFLPKRTQNTTCPNYVSISIYYCFVMLFLQQDKHHSPQKKRFVMRGRWGKRTPTSMLQGPAAKSLHEKSQPKEKTVWAMLNMQLSAP